LQKRNWKKTVTALAVVSVLMIIGLAVLYLDDINTPITPPKNRGVIGVIHIDGVIDTQKETDIITASIETAKKDSSVSAVIVKINSPGGNSHHVEQIYLDLIELKNIKPIVASVSIGLSGGYYIAVASDHIFAQPASMIGNIGVIGTGPGVLIPSENTYETGPQKITGFSPLLFSFNVSKALDAFVNAVEEARGDKLNVDMTELKRGTIYIGSEAAQNGLIDDIGSHQAAIEKAIELADLDLYTLNNLNQQADEGLYLPEEPVNKYPSLEQLKENNPPPAIYYLYIPGDVYMQASGEENNTTEPEVDESKTVGSVVVDLSHGNKVSPWTLDVLSAELAKRGVFVGYSSSWDNVKDALEYAECLIIAAPTEYYTYEQYLEIRKFVNEGKMLIFLSDPSSEFTETPMLLGPINSLSDHWGLHYGKGYLYNLEDYYGFYRNIYIRRFDDTSITSDLNNVVFFTSTYLSSTDTNAAYTTFKTYNSVSEQSKTFSPIAVLNKGNGTVIAFADITWIMEPYIHVEDNYQLAMNLVEAIIDVKESFEQEPPDN
jgi:protease-4